MTFKYYMAKLKSLENVTISPKVDGVIKKFVLKKNEEFEVDEKYVEKLLLTSYVIKVKIKDTIKGDKE